MRNQKMATGYPVKNVLLSVKSRNRTGNNPPTPLTISHLRFCFLVFISMCDFFVRFMARGNRFGNNMQKKLSSLLIRGNQMNQQTN